MGLSSQPSAGFLRSTLEGLGATLRARARLVALITVLYSILFMYFQQTLLIDGLTYTPSGPFRLHLLPGQWVEVSTTPPIPNMPFPLWGTPYISITTNYFDLAVTPLSLGLTLAESFLVALVIALYLDIYFSVTEKLAERSTMGVVQTLTLITIFISCTCEFFEGVLAAVEPAAGIISTELPALLAVVDEAFVAFSLTILATSTIILSARTRGIDLTLKTPREYLWLILYTIPLTLYNVLGGLSEGSTTTILATAIVAAAPIAAAKLTGDRQLLSIQPPLLTYLAVGSLPLPDPGFKYVAPAISALLGATLCAGSKPNKTTVGALLFAAAASPLLDPYLALTPLAMLASSLATRGRKPTLQQYVAYQALSWAPIMLGPLAVAYRPVPPIPGLTLQSQVAFYVYLWLIATPISWYLGVRAIFTLMDRAQVHVVEHPQIEFKINLDEGVILAAVGVLAMAFQAAFYYANPQAFLVSSYNTQTRSLTITTTSLSLFLLGVALLLVGLKKTIVGGRVGFLRPVSLILLDRSKTKVYWAAFTGYLAFSLIAVGTIAWGGQAPPGLPLPSLGVFPSGPLLYAPSATLYLTQNLGVVLVPEHLLVAVVTSMLVATSYKALALISAKPRARRAGLLGAAPAVVLACPTCTATSIYSLLGLNTTIAGLGVLATPFAGTAILAATWIALAATIYHASKKIEPRVMPTLKPYMGEDPTRTPK